MCLHTIYFSFELTICKPLSDLEGEIVLLIIFIALCLIHLKQFTRRQYNLFHPLNYNTGWGNARIQRETPRLAGRGKAEDEYQT